MATGLNPPFTQQGNPSSYYFATSTASATNAIVAGGADTAVVTNLSTGNLYFNFSAASGSSASVGSGYCVPANSQRTVALAPGALWVAGILDAGTGHIFVEIGTGSAR